MGIRLTILGWWTPNYIILRELEKVKDQTTNALRSLLIANSSKADTASARKEAPTARTLEEKRTAMAGEHTVLVEALVEALGRDEAVRLGRETLFKVGEALGRETRERLGVGDNPKDLVKAAKVMYRVLGIRFNIEWRSQTSATLIVDRCALAKNYSDVACLVLSATDEGVVRGLNPKMSMTFDDRIANGCSRCTANIELKLKEG